VADTDGYVSYRTTPVFIFTQCKLCVVPTLRNFHCIDRAIQRWRYSWTLPFPTANWQCEYVSFVSNYEMHAI